MLCHICTETQLLTDICVLTACGSQKCRKNFKHCSEIQNNKIFSIFPCCFFLLFAVYPMLSSWSFSFFSATGGRQVTYRRAFYSKWIITSSAHYGVKAGTVVFIEKPGDLFWLLNVCACHSSARGLLQCLPRQYCPTRSAGSLESFVGASLVLSSAVCGEPVHFIVVLMVIFLKELPLKIRIRKWEFNSVRTVIIFRVNRVLTNSE